MTENNLEIPTVVLVHAAWADASSWNKVIAPLQRNGMPVVAAQIPLTSLAGDVEAVRRTLKRVSGPVVLVGYFYGGPVITAAGNGNPLVKALVYIAAMAPDEGETVGQLLHRAAPHASGPALVPHGDAFLWMSAKGFAEAVAHESSADEAVLLAATPFSIRRELDSVYEDSLCKCWATTGGCQTAVQQRSVWNCDFFAPRAHGRPVYADLALRRGVEIGRGEFPQWGDELGGVASWAYASRLLLAGGRCLRSSIPV